MAVSNAADNAAKVMHPCSALIRHELDLHDYHWQLKYMTRQRMYIAENRHRRRLTCLANCVYYEDRRIVLFVASLYRFCQPKINMSELWFGYALLGIGMSVIMAPHGTVALPV